MRITADERVADRLLQAAATASGGGSSVAGIAGAANGRFVRGRRAVRRSIQSASTRSARRARRLAAASERSRRCLADRTMGRAILRDDHSVGHDARSTVSAGNSNLFVPFPYRAGRRVTVVTAPLFRRKNS